MKEKPLIENAKGKNSIVVSLGNRHVLLCMVGREKGGCFLSAVREGKKGKKLLFRKEPRRHLHRDWRHVKKRGRKGGKIENAHKL